jgi:hypothetical protein
MLIDSDEERKHNVKSPIQYFANKMIDKYSTDKPLIFPSISNLSSTLKGIAEITGIEKG